MGLKRRTAAAFALFCCAVLATSEAQGTASCPGGWRLFRDSCYRLTASALRKDQLKNTCRELGAAAVSIHSAQENAFVASVAGGKYVWLGLSLTGPNKYTWEDGTRYSYAKFLPRGNPMLKRSFVGAGIFQQSCTRWNYDSVSRQLHGVCKMAAASTTVPPPCPSGALQWAGYCYLVASQPGPWWESDTACYETDQRAVAAHLRLHDWQLTNAITDHFGAETKLNIGVDFAGGQITVDSCSWNTLQYGQRTSHSCEFGCAELLPVLCKRPESLDRGSAEPVEPLRMMPPMYKGGDATAVQSASACPSGWANRGQRCVSEPTPAATRGWAEALCQNQYSSRLAAVRQDTSASILALQLQGVHEAWVRDERHLGSSRSPEKVRARAAAPVQTGYSVLTAEGQVLSRPAAAEEQIPAICEHCQMSCGPDSTVFAGHCYRLLEEERTLTNAARSCEALRGTVVSIESAAENRFVTALAFPPSSAQCSQPDGRAWLGLQRVSVAFSWEWVDCSEFSTAFWADSDAGDIGHCATLSQDSFWRSDSELCNQQRLLTVCEWDPCESPRYGGTCLQLPYEGAIY